MAKELAMVENNEKGRIARKYFIECEKKLKEVAPTTYRDAVRKLLYALEEQDRLAQQIEQQKPKVELAEKFLTSTDCITIEKFAKTAGIRSAIACYKILAYTKVLYKRGKEWLATSEWIANGTIKMQTYTYEDKAGNIHTRYYPVVTTQGVQNLLDFLKDYISAGLVVD